MHDGPPRTPHEPVFLDRRQKERAACGRSVKVLLPQLSNTADLDVCGECADAIVGRVRDPEAWAMAERARLAVERKAWRRYYDEKRRQARDLLGEKELDGGESEAIVAIVDGEVLRG